MTFYTSATEFPASFGTNSPSNAERIAISGSVSDGLHSPTTSNGDENVVDNLLHAHEERFCTYHPIRLFITSFNVNGRSPPESLHDWLILDTEQMPDMIIIGLQEMDLALQTYVNDNTMKQNEWLQVLNKNLPNIYKHVAHVRLIGIFLVIYRNENLKMHLSQVCLGQIPTGFFRFGNKGGVGISMRINDSLICFINSHLAAGYNELSKRNQDFREISQMKFSNGCGIYDHEAVIWLGDLNYRLNLASFEDVVMECNSTRFQQLFIHDQLIEQQRLKTAFNGFRENTPSFRPTYKFDVGTSNWDSSEKRRIPAWCDRILWWTRDRNVKLEQSDYKSIERVVFSDHKPVTSIFRLHVKKIDQKKRNVVYEEVLREADRRVNEMLPQISLSNTEFNFKDIYFQQPAVAILTIKNTGLTPTHFNFTPAHDHEELVKRWLTITPSSSFLEVGSTVEVTLQVAIENEQRCGISAPGTTTLMAIMIVHLDRGRDYFVTVAASYQKKDNGQLQPPEPSTEKIVNPPSEGIIIDLDDEI